MSSSAPWYRTSGFCPRGAGALLQRRPCVGPKMCIRDSSTPLYEDDDGVSLREVPVAEHGDWIGRPIKELGIPAEVLIVLVRRADGTTVVPTGGTVLQQGDMLVVNE